jgi:hypothetical protein
MAAARTNQCAVLDHDSVCSDVIGFNRLRILFAELFSLDLQMEQLLETHQALLLVFD